MDYRELEKKLQALGYSEDVVNAVVSAMVSIDKYDLSEDQKYELYSLLSQTGFEAVKSLPEAVADGEWVEFDYGNVQKGDYVRVKKDAYTEPSAVKHNGKVGRLADIYARKCVINYIGLDSGMGMRHPMTKVESLKRR